MNRTTLPQPPTPDSYPNLMEWARATHRWMSNVKTRVETDSTVNAQPVAPFVVGTYTAVNTVTGTDALSNFVATLVASMQQKGITAPVSQRTTT